MSSQDATVKEIQKRFNVNAIFAKRLAGLASGNVLFDDIAEFVAKKPKPFVKWVGGKRQLLSQFREYNLYPPKGFDPRKNTYFEPFVGGGAVFFDLLPEKAYLSDMNEDLVTTYNVIKENVSELIKSLKKHKTDKEYFLRIRSQDVARLEPISRASRFIFLNRTAFNGLYRVNSKGQFNVPFGKYTNPLICDEENLIKVSLALKKVKIEHGDYKKVLNKAKKNDFIYFDPPYHPVNKTSSFTSYTKENFLEKEQVKLRDIAIELDKRGCFVMLSNSDTPFVNESYSQYKNFRVNKVKAGRAINSKSTGRGKISEVVVTNY